MRVPDFFIVGAPKCGTNALYSYLRDHPRVYMPELKEPHYFCGDFPGLAQVDDARSYEALFAQAAPDMLAGEASVWYLFSDVAVKEILQANPAAKIVVALRNPIDMAHSLHAQFVRLFKDHVTDFEAAWRLQEERRAGKRLPPYCPEARCLQYRDVCSFGQQLDRVQSLVPPEQLKVYIFEEFFGDVGRQYADLLEFLGLEPDGREVFGVANENRVVKNHALLRFLAAAASFLPGDLLWYRRVARALGISPLTLLSRYNAIAASRPALSPELRRMVADELADDVRLLERLLGRRMTPWPEFSEGREMSNFGLVAGAKY